ncbi:MAG: hypothetical protein M1827_001013 [Pycnora praestabilis]|nr:MAG: hypothetical protein M1827_001013 [Pycnora praestabilis]
MNGGDERASTDGSLKGFYAYKNTFDEESVWLEIPKQVTFVDDFDPYADPSSPELDGPLTSPENVVQTQYQDGQWNMGTHFQHNNEHSSAHGLEALSAAASGDHYPFMSPSINPEPNLIRHTSFGAGDTPPVVQLPVTTPSSTAAVISPPASMSSSNNNINFILNHSSSSAMSPPIDPNLQSPVVHQATPTPAGSTSSQAVLHDMPPERSIETDHEVAFLIRHFSEGPGQWMDLFDQGTYFASYVPVKALSNPLLKYSAAAYAAKQLGRVKGAKGIVGGVCSRQASMELFPDMERVDWYWYGAKYYDKAISILKDVLQEERGGARLESPNTPVQWQGPESNEDYGLDGRKRRRLSNYRLSGSCSDETLAATAVLCCYEFLDMASTAWSRHLSGTKSLLDCADGTMMSLYLHSPPHSVHSSPRWKITKARKAIFWNFARQDFLAAFINESQTRMDPENSSLWKYAGLLLNEQGFVRPSNTTESEYPEGDDVMREDMISNALIWLMSKLINFVAAGDGIHPTPSGNRLSTPIVDDGSLVGVNQQTLLERWEEIHKEIDIWFQGLPETFKPCARIEPSRSTFRINDETLGSVFTEIWYSIPMCASTMQSYHMARILLLINKPHESTSRRTTVSNRLKSYRSIESDIRYHSHEICGIAIARPEASVRIHSLQPLFVAGQCLTEPRERRVILDLMRSVEADLGWASEYRVKQLLREWDWTESEDTIPELKGFDRNFNIYDKGMRDLAVA